MERRGEEIIAGGWLGKGREELQRKGRGNVAGFLGCQDRGGSFLPRQGCDGKARAFLRHRFGNPLSGNTSATSSPLRSSRRIKPNQFNPYIHKWYARPIPIPIPSPPVPQPQLTSPQHSPQDDPATQAFLLALLTAGGGLTGYIRTGSIPSVAAGMTVGALVRPQSPTLVVFSP